MFDKSLIPQQNASVKQGLTSLYTSSGANADQKSIIDKKLEKIDHGIKDKIANTLTISDYFNQLWTNPELREADKDFAIRKLETIQQNKKLQIQEGEQAVSKSCGNLDLINAAFKMTSFEEFNLQEKIEEFKRENKLDIKVTLNISTHPDPEVLHALNKVSKSAKAADNFHYTSGLIDADEELRTKHAKAEEFVKKIKADKKQFRHNMTQREKSSEKRELEDLERAKRKEKEEEEKRLKEKKEKLEAHIKELQQRGDVRQKESEKWEEHYKMFTSQRPLFRQIEDKFKRSTVIPELEERKQKLKEIRDFHKPIAREDLADHEKKMTKALEDLAAKKELQKQQKDAYEKANPYKKPEYESKYHQKIAEEATKLRNSKENEKMEAIKKKEKMLDYFKDIKEKHAPTVDPSKELELLNMIEKLGKKEPRSKTADDEERHESHLELRKKGLDYLSSVKEQVQEHVRRKKEKALNATKDGEDPSEMPDGKNPLISVKSEQVIKKKNYLAELRRDNKLPPNDPNTHIDNIIKNKKLDKSERKELLQTEVEKLEEKAKRLELLKKYKAKKANDGIEDDTEVDQIYINAIRAKLEMLGN